MKYTFTLCFTIIMFHPSQAQDPYLDWAYKLTGNTSSSLSAGHSVALDRAGNIYSAGLFGNGKTDFDPGADSSFLSQSLNNTSLFILKKDGANNFAWVRSIVYHEYLGGSNTNYINYVAPLAVDDSGNTYLSGTFSGTIDFDPGSAIHNLSSSNGAVFILKLDTNGNLVWTKQLTGQINSNSITTDHSGHLYLAGSFVDPSADFDPGPLTYHLPLPGSGSAFILKLTNAGDFIWGKSIGGTNYTRANCVTTDAAGAVYIAGSFPFTADFDPGPGIYNLTAVFSDQQGGAVQLDAFVCKLDAAGNFAWAKRMGSNMEDGGTFLKADRHGNVYMAGYFRDTATFTPNATPISLAAAGDQDVFITKINTTGNFVWVKKIGGTLPDEIVSLDIDTLGGLYLAGNFYGTADFDPGAAAYNLHATTAADIYIVKTDTAGNFIWATNIGGNDTPGTDDQAKGIAVSPGGDIYSIGDFDGTTDFDPGAGVLNLTGQLYYSTCFMLKWKQSTLFPVKLLSFTALASGNEHVNLQWTTATEQNNKGFELQRSSSLTPLGGQGGFSTINFIPTKATSGTSTSPLTYSYIDVFNTPLGGQGGSSFGGQGGQYYYRLRQMDNDGHSNYSNVVAVNFKQSDINSFSISPNPVISNIKLNIHSIEKQCVQVVISDVSGKVVYAKAIMLEKGNQRINLDCNLKVGTYYTYINFKMGRLVKKLIKQ